MTSGLFKVDHVGKQGDGAIITPKGVLHIPKVLAGEQVEIENGKLKQIVAQSAERSEPFCPYFDACGGCKLQHWTEFRYAAWKRNLVVSSLNQQSIEAEVGKLIDAHGAGRRRIVMHVREIDGVWKAGFMAGKSHDLVAIQSCPVLHQEIAQSSSLAAAYGPSLGPCDVAITRAENGLDVAIKAERSAVVRRMAALQELFKEQKLCRLSINGEAVFSTMIPFVNMGKAQVQLPVNSFLQATQQGEEILSGFVTAGLRKSRNIADLFCGIGPFALRLAETANVFAADMDKAAISSLNQALRNTQGLKPITAETRDLFRNPIVVSELKEFDGAVFDPPRAGAEAQARNLARSRIKRIAAVSCDAQTFARDARLLVDGGYKVKSITPVDQFKWTAHVEIVGIFER